ncbi:MAG: diguanylate cyclase, partial [Proteobacteria bacterium]|nr:diguanylate cyclase [Pseudomonadota bacterium]
MNKFSAYLQFTFRSVRIASGYQAFKLSLVMLLVLWLGILAKHFENRSIDSEGAARDLKNFTSLAEENVLRSIGEMDKAILYLRRMIEAAGSAPDYNRIIRVTDVLSELIVQMAIIDEKGVMRASNVGPQPSPPTDLSDREHYRFHALGSEDVLFISRPVIGRASGKPSVQLARRFKKPDGSFGGVVVASFDPQHFARAYGRVNIGPGSTYALAGRDGIVRSLSNSDGLIRGLGQNLEGTPVFPLLIRHTDAATWLQPSHSSARLIATHPIAGHDLLVVASLPASTVYARSGHSLWVMVFVGLLLSTLIGVSGYRATRSEKVRIEKDRELRLTLEHMTQGIMLVTQDLDVPVMNAQCARLLDLPDDFLATRPKFDAIVAFQQEKGEFASSLPAGASAIDIFGPKNAEGRFENYERTRPDGTIIEVRSTRLDDGGFVRTFSDITQRRRAQAHAEKLASEDVLTGLANRRMFLRTLDLMVEQCESRIETSGSFAVLCLDLDRFKLVNDTRGHAVGDQLLRMVAERLRSSVRTEDFIARLGGDEFAILMPMHDSETAPDLVAERLVETLSRPYEIEGRE